MRLTDNEIRDIARRLESGRPLPDYYRFLLFEEKREEELVSNGKTNEVCNATLPFQVIEQVDEPRSGGIKKNEIQMDFFDRRGRQIKGWTNKLIWGDNKLILSSLKNGRIIKVTKDEQGIIKRVVLTRKWSDWIDYWAVDFDFESRKEIVRGRKDDGSIEEVWTGDYVFENEWQSFRTRRDRAIELRSAFRECPRGRRKIAVKVVDIFGNDTMKVIEVNV